MLEFKLSTPPVIDTEVDTSVYATKEPPACSAPWPAAPRTFAAEACLVLIGIHGYGKHSLGFVAATALKRRFITGDHYIRGVIGVSVGFFCLRLERNTQCLPMLYDYES
ncbi:hypothetical protein PEX2_095280 [Penicillium expansum]|uniref:Uncharacterized protein n=1 Tax=Penicillium expansum TaxID=27334 RepID=A0A0A2JET2_PENEN|nr:hypothetical protein PEX2_095280 [Penicillium expansum]KGO50830.1 hypothetical protein PEX2_095280 [Penicillium expansum]